MREGADFTVVTKIRYDNDLVTYNILYIVCHDKKSQKSLLQVKYQVL